MFAFCNKPGCAECEPARGQVLRRHKRPRRSWPAGPPVHFALANADSNDFLSSSYAVEPLFVLERLAHIRCFTLTLCGPPGTQLLGASVRVSGTVVDALCELGIPLQRRALTLVDITDERMVPPYNDRQNWQSYGAVNWEEDRSDDDDSSSSVDPEGVYYPAGDPLMYM